MIHTAVCPQTRWLLLLLLQRRMCCRHLLFHSHNINTHKNVLGMIWKRKVVRRKRRDNRAIPARVRLSCKELQGAARTNTSSPSILNLDNPALLVHAMTRRESVQNCQRHAADQLKIFVKHTLFRGIKFVNNKTMIQKAMKKVMDHENVEDHHRVKFHMLYESAFVEALNSKQSSCEQGGNGGTLQVAASQDHKGERDILLVLRRVFGVCLWHKSLGCAEVH